MDCLLLKACSALDKMKNIFSKLFFAVSEKKNQSQSPSTISAVQCAFVMLLSKPQAKHIFPPGQWGKISDRNCLKGSRQDGHFQVSERQPWQPANTEMKNTGLFPVKTDEVCKLQGPSFRLISAGS